MIILLSSLFTSDKRLHLNRTSFILNSHHTMSTKKKRSSPLIPAIITQSQLPLSPHLLIHRCTHPSSRDYTHTHTQSSVHSPDVIDGEQSSGALLEGEHRLLGVMGGAP